MLVLKRVEKIENNKSMKNESRSLINRDYTRYNNYIKEADEKEEESIDFTNAKVLEEIKKSIKGVDISTKEGVDSSTPDKLNFKFNGKNGSLQIKGYMLCLDIDNDADIPSTNYPIKDKNNLSLDNLMEAVKTVFSRRNKLEKAVENYLRNEDHCMKCVDGKCTHCADDSCCDKDVKNDNLKDDKEDKNISGDDALSCVKEPLYYILVGDKQDPYVGTTVMWDEVVGDENGYDSKSEAILAARDLLRNDPEKSHHAYAVTGKVNVCYFIDNSFWDALDSMEIPVIWNSMEDQAMQDEFPEDFIDDTSIENTEFSDIDLNNPIFMDVAKTKLLEKLGDSLIIVSDSKKENLDEDMDALDDDKIDDSNIAMICLSPSYAMNPLSTIVIPVSLNGRMVSMPLADIPDPEVVFDGNYTENSMSDYDSAIQDFILKDAQKSDLMELSLDNVDDVKARIVDAINSMAEDYQNNKSKLENLLDLSGDSVLKEARYYLIPMGDDPKTMDDVKKITPMGFTDINIARDSMHDFSENGKYTDGLVILDTHFSNNNEKWEIL